MWDSSALAVFKNSVIPADVLFDKIGCTLIRMDLRGQVESTTQRWVLAVLNVAARCTIVAVQSLAAPLPVESSLSLTSHLATCNACKLVDHVDVFAPHDVWILEQLQCALLVRMGRQFSSAILASGVL